MEKNSSVHLAINIFILALILFAHTIYEKIPYRDLQKAKTVKKKVSIPLDQAMLKDMMIEFSVQETKNLKLIDTKYEEARSEGWWEKMISFDNEGYQVLGGLREDPSRYQYEGNCSGIVTRDDTGELIAGYEFQVLKILAGKTERLADAFLVCKGTYWLPAPVQKPDLEWKSVPPTLAWYEVPASGHGVMLKADRSIPGKFLRFKSSKHSDSRFILSSELEPLLFGKGSVHVPVH